MGEIVKTVNNGPEIVSTSYWHTEAALRGYVYLSINAGCFRLLVPDAFVTVNSWIKEAISRADCVIITRGPWREMGKSDGIEILFEDHSDEPYALHIVPEQVELMPAASARQARTKSKMDDAGLHGTWRVSCKNACEISRGERDSLAQTVERLKKPPQDEPAGALTLHQPGRCLPQRSRAGPSPWSRGGGGGKTLDVKILITTARGTGRSASCSRCGGRDRGSGYTIGI